MNPLGVLWFFLPAFVANMTPVLLKRLPILNYPIDFGATLYGSRLFGNNKTWRGLIFGTLAGTLVFALQQQATVPFALFTYSTQPLHLGFLLSVGALIGDLIKSFFKRQLGIKPGNPWYGLDQVDYIIGGLVFAAPIYLPEIADILFLFIAGITLTVMINNIGVYLKLRKTW